MRCLLASLRRNVMLKPSKPRSGQSVRPIRTGAIVSSSLAILIVVSVFAQESAGRRHPDALGESGSWGQTWTSASLAFDEHGSVSTRISPPLREQLLVQSADFRSRFGSAATQGLTDGEIPPRRFCSPAAGMFVGDQPPPEYSSFDLHLLLSEVAVSAEVAEVVPGFYYDGEPAALLSLRNVEPLHAHAPLPEYALVPLGQLVVRDRVICGSAMRPAYNFSPSVGSRIVVVSRWGDQAVAMGALSLAVVHAGGELEWKFGPQGPGELESVMSYAHELEVRNLFGVSHALAGRPVGSEDRRQFIEQWERLRRHSCLDSETLSLLGAGRDPEGSCPGIDEN